MFLWKPNAIPEKSFFDHDMTEMFSYIVIVSTKYFIYGHCRTSMCSLKDNGISEFISKELFQ